MRGGRDGAGERVESSQGFVRMKLSMQNQTVICGELRATLASYT